MNLYQVNYDTVLMTLYAHDVDDMVELLNEEVGDESDDTDDFYLSGEILYCKSNGGGYCACQYREVDAERGIVQIESH